MVGVVRNFVENFAVNGADLDGSRMISEAWTIWV